MSKYDFSKSGYIREEALQAIANELAEANRLQKIQIRSMFVIANTNLQTPFALDDSNGFLKDLEGNAK